MKREQDIQWHLQRLSTTNRKKVFQNLLLLIVAIALLLVPYALVLSYMAGAGTLGIVLFFSVQVIIGLLATRAAFQLGIVLNKFQTPPAVGVSTHLGSIVETPIAESALTQVFERFQVQYHKSSTTLTDDFTDLGWFLVIVYATATTMVAILSSPFGFLGPSVAFVQGAVVVGLLLVGFKKAVPEKLDDLLVHLEYIVTVLLRGVIDATVDFGPHLVVRWISSLGNSTLQDIVIVYHSMEFRLRIASKRPASIVLQNQGPQLDEVLSRVPEEWKVFSHDGSLEIEIPRLSLNMSRPTSWLLAPDTVEELSVTIGSVLRQLLAVS